MLKKEIFACVYCFLLLISFSGVKAQNSKSVWDSIKSNTSPVVEVPFQSEYAKPFKQPLADYGWEDGLHISPDGLNLYALYSPMDFFPGRCFLRNILQPCLFAVCLGICHMCVLMLKRMG